MDYKRLNVDLTIDEMDMLKKKAKSCNLTVSKYVRFMIKKDKINSLKGLNNHIIEEKIGSLDKQLSKIGMNVKQIVYHLNERGSVDTKTIEKLGMLIESIEKRMELIERTIVGEYIGSSENKRC